MINLIDKLFKQHKIVLNSNQLEQFKIYLELLLETNKQFNLTSITEPTEVIVKHFIDSTLNYTYYKENTTLCDIGSGAGFPGIPLKILRPDLDITLIDSLNKRVNFLNNVIKTLKFTKIKAIHTRIQELTQYNVSRETFDYTTARAVAPLNILIEYCIPYTKVNGIFIALKSNDALNEIKLSDNALNILNSKVINLKEYKLFLNNETLNRNIIYIQKTNTTSTKYPRLKNIIKTKPL